MRIKTLIEHKNQLQVADVELALLPGIPNIHFLGLPDQSIKESFFRIKSALKSSGYKFPGNQQVIVNIHPSQLRKSSQGLELAVALGILSLTGQKQISFDLTKTIVYGEMGLNGDVFCPQNLSQFLENSLSSSLEILTGETKVDLHAATDLGWSQHQVGDLLANGDHQRWTLQNIQHDPVRQDSKTLRLSEEEELNLDENLKSILLTDEEAEVVELACLTGMNLLLCGAPGTGKTTLAKNFSHFAKYGIKSKRNLSVLMPHHSITPAGFIGGGAQLSVGEIERVRGGILIMDEFLEFQPVILESLRGPMLGEPLRLVRSGSARMVMADFQVIATTNLCPCGKWTPLSGDISCRFSRMKCTRYLDRLSGPMLDRFGLFYTYPKIRKPRTIKAVDVIRSVLNKKWKLSQKPKGKDQRMNGVDFAAIDLSENLYADLSPRRLESMRRAIQTTTFEDDSQRNLTEAIKKAARYTVESFEGLEKGH